MLENAKWICMEAEFKTCCPVFKKQFTSQKEIKHASLQMTSVGCYEAYINDSRVGDFVFAPGWTSYESRLQVQTYDVTELLEADNTIKIYVGAGWHLGRIANNGRHFYSAKKPAVILELAIEYKDGTKEIVISDESFLCARSGILFSCIYDGELFDARERELHWESVTLIDYNKKNLIPQEGVEIHETERIKPVGVTVLKNGNRIVDFGQNMTGYVEFTCNAPEGTVVRLVHGEILDKEGNVYTANLRSAKQTITYIANGKETQYKPHFTFQGFRYVQVENMDVDPEKFTAVVVHSDIKRIGTFTCSNEKLNTLYQNILWGLRGNFLEVPMDCPQRDERLGWTGDAQIFMKAAAYNYDVHRFFAKWLNDLRCDQYEDGGVPEIIPDVLDGAGSSAAAYGDAVTICPWTVYMFYGDKELLCRQYESMEKWVLYLRNQGDNLYLRNADYLFGDWLALDAGKGEYEGATSKVLIGTAFYAYSTSLLIKAGKVLGYDMRAYETLYQNIIKAYRKEFIKDGRLTCETQTAYVLTVMFDLSEDSKAFGDILDDMLKQNDYKRTTGFVGTPYLLHALTKTGHVKTAYTLLLQESFPSWLYAVNLGATTVWEHWDGIDEEGNLWSSDMNSFNHYALGAVCDWMYETVAGLRVDEENPAFEHVILSPVPDKRLGRAEASVQTRYGIVSSGWEIDGDKVVYTCCVPNRGTLYANGETKHLEKGTYTFVWDYVDELQNAAAIQ